MTPFQKSVLATVLVGIALVQLATIGLALGKVGGLSPAARGKAALFHRAGGLIGIAIAVIVAFYCLKLWPNSYHTGRVWIHATIGTFLLGLMVAKVTIRSAFNQYYSRLWLLGSALFITVIVQWVVSAGWYFYYLSPGY